VSADGRWVASGPIEPGIQPGCGTPQTNRELRVWDIKGKRSFTLKPPPEKVFTSWAIAISYDGQRVALLRHPMPAFQSGKREDIPVEDQSADLTVWDVGTEKERMHIDLRTSLREASHGLVFSPDGSMIALGLKLFDSTTGREVGLISAVGPGYQIVSFSPDGRRLAAVVRSVGPSSELPTLSVWEVATGKQLMTKQLDRSAGMHLSWSPDGMRLAVCNHEGQKSVVIYDAATGTQEVVIESPNRGFAIPGGGVRNLTFSPDGKRIALEMPSGQLSSSRVVGIWDATNGKELLTLRPEQGRSRLVNTAHVGFTPDGHKLAYFQLVREGGGVDTTTNVVVTTWDATPISEQPKKP
jgi:WD40 repeat protein